VVAFDRGHHLAIGAERNLGDPLEAARASIADAGRDSLVGLSAIVRRKIHEVIGLTADVSVVPPKTIGRSAGKAKRVLDLRQSGR